MPSPTLPPLLFLMGPTASGKTALSLELAKHLPIEIISVDSAMVYRGMDIGTGKPTPEEQATVPHHLIDIREPNDPYSAADFRKDALKAIHDIHTRKHIPVLVGGTLLYFRALEKGLSPLPSANQKIREKLEQEAKTLGWKALHHRLATLDPSASSKINPNDSQRIQRALEVYEMTGLPLSHFWQLEKNQSELSQFHIHKFALLPQHRAVLHERIEQRFYTMLNQGLIEEVKQLFDRHDHTVDRKVFQPDLQSDLQFDLHPELPALRAVGYRQIWRYLQNEYSYDLMILKSIAATRQLAKRQLTWLRSLSELRILNLEDPHSDSVKSMIHCVTLDPE